MNVKKSIQNNWKNLLFGALYFLWGAFFLVYKTVNIPKPPILDKFRLLLNLVVLAALLFLILLDWIKDWQKGYYSKILFSGIFLAIAFIVKGHGDGWLSLVMFVFLLASASINFNYILSAFLGFSGLVMMGSFFLSSRGVNILRNFISVRAGHGAIRYSLGFNWVTNPAQLAFFFVAAYVVLRNKKTTYWEMLLLELVSGYIYFYTDTINPFLLTTVLLAYMAFERFRAFKPLFLRVQFFKSVLSYPFALAAALMFMGAMLPQGRVFQLLNRVFNRRFWLSYNGLVEYGIHPFGQRIVFRNQSEQGGFLAGYNYVDSSYIQYTLLYGIFFILFIIVALSLVTRNIVSENNELLAVVLAILAIHAMFDPQLLWLWYSPFTMLIGIKCFNPRQERQRFKWEENLFGLLGPKVKQA
ncbi:MAG: polymerase [Lactobacillus equicursoris]|uniref:polymerase n=1 Tax=Lactobacillus equicursoris TaxID=420645 RepID=UPI00243137AA|nr:polymerase [Lactobacillus equicursoris]MDD6407562.1 polymerase [Lactobacillus equicursoris]